MIFSWIRQLILILRYINHDLQKCIFEKYINRIFYDQYIKKRIQSKSLKYPKKPERPIPPFKMRRKDFEKSKKKNYLPFVQHRIFFGATISSKQIGQQISAATSCFSLKICPWFDPGWFWLVSCSEAGNMRSSVQVNNFQKVPFVYTFMYVSKIWQIFFSTQQ